MVRARDSRPSRALARLAPALALLLGACVGADPAAGREPAAARAPATAVASSAVATATPRPAPTPLPDAAVEALLARAVCWYADPALARGCLPPQPDALAAIDEMALSGDPRFVVPLVDLATLDIGWAAEVDAALSRLTGASVAGARAWREWLLAHPPAALPPGYAGWKARLLALTSTPETRPGYPELLSERLGAALPLLHWTQVQPSARPALTTPRAVAGRTTDWLTPDDVVYGLALNGEVRAYPRRILAWHGVVNDVLGGQPVLLSYCLPCGGAAAFDRRLDAATLEFGTAGLALQSRTLLFDREGARLWDALTGAALGEPPAALAPIPMFTSTWADWFDRHPETTVLDLATGVVRDYATGSAIREVVEAPGPLYPAAPLDGRLPAKEPVLGVLAAGAPRAYPLAEVERLHLIQERVGDFDVVVVSEGPGRAAAAYRAEGVRFERLADSGIYLVLEDTEGRRWAMRESALIEEDSRRTLPALPSRQAYWFAWSGAYPATGVFGLP